MSADMQEHTNLANLIPVFRNSDLRTIAEKIIQGTPVSEADALTMLTTNDVMELGLMADAVKTKLHGDVAFYSVNMNLNYTNICELRCPLCAFSCSSGDANAYTYSIDDIESLVGNAVRAGIDEVHIVGGLNPELKIDYFEEMLRRIKGVKEDIFIVAFTAVEYDYFARINNLSLEEVFSRLIDAGLGALPGGGAEIFSPNVRNEIAPRKISGGRWLEVMRTAHKMGLKTNATMLYNHIEQPQDIVGHLANIRNLQDETSGFKTFVPLAFHEANTQVAAKRRETSGFQDIRIFSAARIFLHNVPHIKALWMYLGEKMAQVLLRFGADDMSGTYRNEKVVHAAGAPT
ncbi:MAG: CofH family radical SAM protein, partial [Syntrophaceae bacterium]|nr:CofH family radical SAM protein [Syntrophaceae bacterium]